MVLTFGPAHGRPLRAGRSPMLPRRSSDCAGQAPRARGIGMAERGYLLVREDDAEAKSAETRRNRRTKEGRARPAIYRRRRLRAAPSWVEGDSMSKTLKEVIVAFLLTFDRGWDSTEQANCDLLNDLDQAGFVIAPKEPTTEMLAIADMLAGRLARRDHAHMASDCSSAV